MVSKSLVYRKVYENVGSLEDIPNITTEDIIERLKAIPLVSDVQDYEFCEHPVNFRNVLEETRKDFVVNDRCKKIKRIYGTPNEYSEFKFGNVIKEEEVDGIIKDDIVSFFTVIKDGLTELRIYKIGHSYYSKEIDNLEYLREQHIKDEDYNKAIKVNLEIIELNPDDDLQWEKLAELYLKMRLFDKAIETCEKVLELTPRPLYALEYLATALYKKENYKKALDILFLSIYRFYHNSRSLYRIAEILFKLGSYQNAYNVCNEILSFDQSSYIYPKTEKLMDGIKKIYKPTKIKKGVTVDEWKDKGIKVLRRWTLKDYLLAGYAVQTSYSNMVGGEYHVWWLDESNNVKFYSTNEDLLNLMPDGMTIEQATKIIKSIYKNEFFTFVGDPLRLGKPHELELVDGIGDVISDRLIRIGIDNLEKLTKAKIEDLIKLDGVGKKSAEKFIKVAPSRIEYLKLLEVYKIKEEKKLKKILKKLKINKKNGKVLQML